MPPVTSPTVLEGVAQDTELASTMVGFHVLAPVGDAHPDTGMATHTDFRVDSVDFSPFVHPQRGPSLAVVLVGTRFDGVPVRCNVQAVRRILHPVGA